ncbi:hypothetical protein J5J10_14690 [Ciceribacter sp. L1K23]|uniref:AsmA family protein n=1 Tax=Ciceribacter sp. L1K23 TaxID=2820276 RepID=UPI001B829494|nr:AsmA-like C-terminal region-containing protein [Ciceribacter sp. L1K23]MBR0556932.1 hypothetical protein [Ciceribacter sp. L1K23]
MTEQPPIHEQDRDDRRRGFGAIVWRRPMLLVVVAPLLLYLLLLILAPLLVSTSAVRGALEDAVSEWSGHRATIGGTPELTFWPEPEIALPSVTISRRAGGEDVVLARIERLSASFGLIDGMFGRPVLGEFVALRPEVWLRRDEEGNIDWHGDGRLTTAIGAATSDTGEAAVVDAAIGDVTVIDGRLRVEDAVTGRSFSLDDIDARLDWPRLSSAMTVSADASIRGRRFGFDLASRQPLQLFGGRDAETRLALRLQNLTTSFEGTANLSGDYLLNGPLQIEASDLAAFITWSGLKLGGTENIRQARVSGQLTTIGGSYRLDGLKASFDGSDATGIIELTPPSDDRKARLSGTLAFDRIDLADLLDAFRLLPGPHDPDGKASGLTRWLDTDLTLSADRALFAPIQVDDFAASIVVVGDSRRFDLLDGTLENGRVTARLTDASGSVPGELRATLSGIDLETLFGRLALSGPLPYTRASADIVLALPRPVDAMTLADLSGSLQIRAAEGEIRPFDLSAIAALARERPFFRLADAPGGELDFTAASLHLELHDGIADIAEAFADTDAGRLTLDGIIPLATRSLALALSVEDDDQKSRAEPPLRLFVGGSWPDVVVSPMAAPRVDPLE